MKEFKIIVAAAVAFATAAWVETCQAYAGNNNFRNLTTSFAAKTRTNWVTNAVDASLSAPLDWSKGETISPGITYVPAVLNTAGGWARKMVCHFVRVDLTTPGLRFTGTDRCADWGEDMPEQEALKSDGSRYKKRTVREKTGDFIARNRGPKSKGGKARDARLAFNAAAWGPWVSPYTNQWGDINGPFYGDGIQVSGAKTGYGTHSSSSDQKGIFVIYKTGKADIIGQLTSSKVKQVWFSVPAFVYRLVRDGQPQSFSDTSVRPRTAIGLSEDKNTFYLLVCDGDNESAWSKGADFTSLGKMLAGMGCHNAFNLDGGGSSNICAWDDENNRPNILSRPGGNYSQRDNGANAAIYYKMPEAKMSSYFYEDFDFLMQDIIDGEAPTNTTSIYVLGDATFTAEHPYVPKHALRPSANYTLLSTNNASVGWAEDVTPQLAAGSTVTFKNLRFREPERELVVPAGATLKLNGVTGLGGVSIANSSALVVAGSVPEGLRVRCAAATQVGEVFASTTLAIDAARVEAKKILCATDETLIAEAVTVGSAVKFRWTKIVTFAGRHGKIAETLDRGIVNVRVSECGSEYLSGYKLKLTVTSEDGLRTATQFLDFAGPGEYVFDTTGASDPMICAVGYGYSYKIEFVDADGEKVAFTNTLMGRMGLGDEKPWFKACASDDSAVGGSWVTKPEITNGVYDVEETSDAMFLASAQKGERVRFEMRAVFRGYMAESRAQAALAQFAECGTPHGACFPAKVNNDGNLAWRALVKENGNPAFKTLYGPVPINTPCKVITDVDWSSGSPRVRYSVATGNSQAVLADADGEVWFAGASSANAAAGRMVASGTGYVASLCGKAVIRKLLKRFSLIIR